MVPEIWSAVGRFLPPPPFALLPLLITFERLTCFNKRQSVDENILSKEDSNISKVLLYGDHAFNDVKNTSISTASIEYVISTKRFDAPFYQN